MTQTSKAALVEDATPVIDQSGAPQNASAARAAIFGNAPKQRREPYEFNGVPVEFLQPLIGGVYNGDGYGDKNFIITNMIRFTVFPGTEDRVFEDSDYDQLLMMPMSADMKKVVDIIQDLFNLDVKEAAKN